MSFTNPPSTAPTALLASLFLNGTLLITDCLIRVTNSLLVGEGRCWDRKIKMRRYGWYQPLLSREGAEMRKKSLTSNIGPLTTAYPQIIKPPGIRKKKLTSSYSCFPNITFFIRLLKYLVIREKQQYCVTTEP